MIDLRTKKAGMKRTLEFAMKAEDVQEDGSFVCYGAVFNNVDQGGDIIAPGAFATSLSEAKEDGRLIPMLWQHDRDEPIGSWSKIEEDETGLRCEGKILLDAGPVETRAYSHLKNGSVGGFSIGYHLKPDGYEVHPDYPDDEYIWLLHDIDLREVSLVTMPMNLEARLVSIKNALDAGGMPTERDFEYLLREACGFSKKTAVDFSRLCRPLLRRGEPGAPVGKDESRLLAGLAAAFDVK